MSREGRGILCEKRDGEAEGIACEDEGRGRGIVEGFHVRRAGNYEKQKELWKGQQLQ